MNQPQVPPQLRIWQIGLGFANTAVFHALIKAGVIEQMREQSRSLAELAQACDLNADMLYRTLRFAAVNDVVTQDGDQYALTDVGRLLLKDVPGMDGDRLQQERRLLEGQWLDHKAKLERIEADIVSKEAELRSTQEVVKKIEDTLPIVDRRAEAFKGLFQIEAVSEQQYREAEKALLDLQGDWASTLQKLRSIRALHEEALKQKESLVAETRRTVLDSRHEAVQKVTTNSQELIKAQQRNKLMKLVG